MELDGDPPTKVVRVDGDFGRTTVPQLGIEFVSDYSDDIFNYWLVKECKQLRNYYLEEGITEMNQNHRSVAVRALFQIHQNMHMSDKDSASEVLSLAIKLQDMYYMAKPDADIRSMFLVSLASHSVADKAMGMYYDLNSLEYYSLFSDRRYDCRMIYDMEVEILKSINYESILVTGAEIIRRAQAQLFMNIRTKMLARYVLEASQLFYEFIIEHESRMTAAAQYIANKYAKIHWNEAMEHFFGYKEKEIVSLAFKVNQRLVDWVAPKEIVGRFRSDEQAYIKQHKFRAWSIKKNKKTVEGQ